MPNILKYLTHRITATNQHGIHSPFVYDYVTKCLYSNPTFKASKADTILLKSISYFKIENLKMNRANSRVENLIRQKLTITPKQHPPFDMVIMDFPQADAISSYQNKMHNDSVLFIENIHEKKEAATTWKILKQDKTVSVSIDLFYCGLLFFRKEQVKEHFKIRF